MKADTRFFYVNAGWSYGPGETPDEGRRRCAAALATAERKGRAAGLSFSWEIDPDSTSADWSDERPAWAQYQCTAYDADGGAVAYLGGIDFGRDGSPHSDSYRRVVEAELAAEALA